MTQPAETQIAVTQVTRTQVAVTKPAVTQPAVIEPALNTFAEQPCIRLKAEDSGMLIPEQSGDHCDRSSSGYLACGHQQGAAGHQLADQQHRRRIPKWGKSSTAATQGEHKPSVAVSQGEHKPSVALQCKQKPHEEMSQDGLTAQARAIAAEGLDVTAQMTDTVSLAAASVTAQQEAVVDIEAAQKNIQQQMTNQASASAEVSPGLSQHMTPSALAGSLCCSGLLEGSEGVHLTGCDGMCVMPYISCLDAGKSSSVALSSNSLTSLASQICRRSGTRFTH